MRTSRQRSRSRGQILIVFVISIFAFVGLCAVVIDVSWYWSSSLRMQRAADAAALAGVVNLPGREDLAILAARAEAKKNGYEDSVGGVVVTPAQDASNHRRLNVKISGPVGTFFARVLGINSFQTSRTSNAEYTLPVPMGSPENYYGVFGLTRGLTSFETQVTPINTPSSLAITGKTAAIPNATSSTNWSANAGVTIPVALANNESDTTAAARYASTTTNNATLDLGNFGLTSGLAANQDVTAVTGLQVLLDDAYVSAACTTTRILVQVSYDGGLHWSTSTTTTRTATLGINTATVDTAIGATANLTAWTFAGPVHTWGITDFDQANFKVRLTANKGCGTSGTEIRLDQLRVNANYSIMTHTSSSNVVQTNLTDQNLQGPGTACPLGVANCFEADGSTLNPRGFWGTMNSQGAANANGDAYQPFYDTAGGTVAPLCATAPSGVSCYDPTNYYNYAIEMPLGATNGQVYIYDPVFCATNNAKGTGDRWFTGNVPVTSTFELYDTNDTIYDQSDDGLPLGSSGPLFRKVDGSDTSMGGPTGQAECKSWSDQTYGDGRDYHDNWYRLYSGMTGGLTGPKVYRLHTTSTDPTSVNDQKNVDAENSFAFYASASGGTPRLYGIGAMQAFTPLKAGSGASSTTVTSTFYLAEIEKAHAGKSVEISLWDPGDTTPLTASLEILIPTGTNTWAPTALTYHATLGTSNSGRADGLLDSNGKTKPDCRVLSRTTASNSPISTFDNTAASTTGKFNGCWLTIDAAIPTTYNAAAGQDWWQIRYTMTGNGTSNDVTTWKADIRGNPVHLVLP